MGSTIDERMVKAKFRVILKRNGVTDEVSVGLEDELDVEEASSIEILEITGLAIS